MHLYWHKYRYLPYEKVLAERELRALVDYDEAVQLGDGLNLTNVRDSVAAKQLTYFDRYVNGHGFQPTLQSRVEAEARISEKRQSTRYSVHGLHEYKGKFNPQVARALLNIFGAGRGKRVLDPFCGSGTTLVEATRLGAQAYGTDLNPLAILIANSKLHALNVEPSDLHRSFEYLKSRLDAPVSTDLEEDERSVYLNKWFAPNVLNEIEFLRNVIRDTGDLANIFLVVASDLLRDYSLQDPKDLRIRRRSSPLPEKPFIQCFLDRCKLAIDRVASAQSILGKLDTGSTAILRDNSVLNAEEFDELFDCAVTSPPYATALPYIDTQRLSLVWLDLVSPREIASLEGELIGSRELRGTARYEYDQALDSNLGELPEKQAEFCLILRNALSDEDGFRRKAVPKLLYRYFTCMKDSMQATQKVLRRGAKYALIVGHNHTTLGGHRFDIDTPAHLSEIATEIGWNILELLPLQTYQRYAGYHVGNAVASETLIILEKN